MPFTATTNPSITALYVNKFIDTPNSLSFITVTNGGSYASRPTVYLSNSSGSNGSGALLEPVFSGGSVMGIIYVYVGNYTSSSTYSKTDAVTTAPDYVSYGGNIYKYINAANASNRQPDTNPTYWQLIGPGGTGKKKGTGYSNGIAPIINFSGGTPSVNATATIQLSNNTTILGVTANENSLLTFCNTNRINHLILYDLNAVNWGGSSSSLGTQSSPGKQMLANFMVKARTSGITTFSANRSSAGSNIDQIVAYNAARASANEKFEWFCVEDEWWNGAISFASFISNLRYIHDTCTGNSISTELYIGWPSTSESAQIVQFVDRLQFHDYSSRLYPDYGYTKTRIIDAANGCAAINKIIQIGPIFSAEYAWSPWNEYYNFMGLWYSSHTINQAWEEWAISSPNSAIATLSYNKETNVNVRAYLNPIGHFIFDNTLVRSSLPISPPASSGGCSTTITSIGSTTIFSGSSVTLSATNISSGTSVNTVPQFDHILIVLGENRLGTTVYNAPGSTYIRFLADNGARFTNSHALSHPSQPNYLQLFSGFNQGVTDDSTPHTFTTPNIAKSLENIGKTCKIFSEDMPNSGYTGASFGGSDGYWRKHNPLVNWQGVGTNQVPSSTNETFSAYTSIANTGSYSGLPALSWVIPNQFNDGHNASSNNAAAAQYSSWIGANLSGYANYCSNPSNRSLLIVTYDEDDSSTGNFNGTTGNNILTVFYGGLVSTGTFSNLVTHYNVLRTMEDGLGLTTHVGASVSNTPITNVWRNTLGSSITWSPNGETLNPLVVTASGVYYATVTNSSGCTSISNAITVTVVQLTGSTACTPTISYSPPLSFVSGGSVVLTASTGTTYSWSPNGETTRIITATTSGLYSVSVSGGTCTGASSGVTVTVYQSGGTCVPTITYIGNPYFTGNTIYSGQSVVLSSVTSGSSYVWQPYGETTKSITATNAGNYFVSVVNSGGTCTGTSVVISLNVLPAPDINIYYSTPIAFPPGGSVTLTATSGSSYFWSPNGETGQTITVSVTGNYFVTVDTGSGYTGNSEVVFVDANYIPPTTLTTEMIIYAYNSTTYINYTDGTISFPLLSYSLFLSNPSISDYYIFVKIRRKNSVKQAGIKIITENAENFLPITNTSSNAFSWYRLEANGIPIPVRLYNSISDIKFQAVNDRLEFEQFAVSNNADFISGPYPITTP